MTKKEKLGREIAEYMDRCYDDEEEGKMARDLARWLLDNYEIHKKRI